MKKCSKVLSFIFSIVCIVSFSSCEVIDILSDTTSKVDTAISSGYGLNIHMIDIGQGDSILLECENNYMLIDAGEVNKGETVVEYLKENNIDKIDYALITHPHSDHYGGMKTVLENVETKNIVMTEAINTTRTWENLIDYIDEKNYNVIFPETNDTINLGSTVLTMYVPEVVKELNNCSIVVKAEFEGISAIFTGDAETGEEKEILNSEFDVSANILKAGHHGSRTSTGKKFLKAVNPQIALISCGKDNDYGHPHNETISKFNENNIPMYRTDIYGSIVVNLNKNKMSIKTTSGYSEEITVQSSEQGDTDDKNTSSSKSDSDKSDSSKSNSNKTSASYVGTETLPPKGGRFNSG